MAITAKQAFLIGKKLYVQSRNQKHCQDWAQEHLTHDQASQLLSKLLRVTYDMTMKNPTEATEITAWGRKEISTFGYVEPQFNKAI